jgi:hypothetical protein
MNLSSNAMQGIREWVKSRIATASLVVADLSDANPNVYLEVGYAWGCGRSTVLLVQDTGQLKFDVRGQRCLVYKRIQDLEASLRAELQGLKGRLLQGGRPEGLPVEGAVPHADTERSMGIAPSITKRVMGR